MRGGAFVCIVCVGFFPGCSSEVAPTPSPPAPAPAVGGGQGEHDTGRSPAGAHLTDFGSLRHLATKAATPATKFFVETADGGAEPETTVFAKSAFEDAPVPFPMQGPWRSSCFTQELAGRSLAFVACDFDVPGGGTWMLAQVQLQGASREALMGTAKLLVALVGATSSTIRDPGARAAFSSLLVSNIAFTQLPEQHHAGHTVSQYSFASPLSTPGSTWGWVGVRITPSAAK